MIVLDQVTKIVASKFGRVRVILSSVSLEIPSDRRIAIFSSVAEDLRILVNLLAGLVLPNSGSITRQVQVSFPIGSLGGFDLQLTARENAAHAARLYGADSSEVVEFVREVSGLRDGFDQPLGRLTPIELRRLGHIIAYSIPFDTYLHLSDFTGPGQRKELGSKVLELTDARAKSSGILIPTRNLKNACEVCEMALVLYQGRLSLVDDVREAPYVLWQTSETKRTQEQLSNVATLKKIFGQGF